MGAKIAKQQALKKLEKAHGKKFEKANYGRKWKKRELKEPKWTKAEPPTRRGLHKLGSKSGEHVYVGVCESKVILNCCEQYLSLNEIYKYTI